MTIKTDLHHFKKQLLGSWIAASLIIVSPSLMAAEEELVDEEESGHKMMILGSNIRSIDREGTAPVQSFSLDDFELTNIGTISDLVTNLPANSGSVVNPVSGSNIGVANFNLRNLGPGSTLVLINGRRAGKSPLADSLGNQFYDLNQLPLAMISSIDVQTDGASAIYGSEAVAGVVNLVTRKGFEGLEFSARYEDASNETQTYSLAFGSNSDRGSFAAYATLYKASINYRSDLDFIVRRSGGSLTSSSGSPDEYITLDPLTNARGSTAIRDPHCEEAGGFVRGNTCRYDFFDHTSPVPKEDRFAAFVEFDYDLGDIFGLNSVNFYGEFSYSNNTATRAIGPQTNGNGPFGGKFLIPSSHPFNFFVDGANGLEYIDPTTAAGAAFWQANPDAAANLTTSGSFRPIGQALAGRNSGGSDFTNNSNREMVGIDAEIGRDWIVSGWFQNYQHKTQGEEAGNSIASALQAALLDGSLNPFGIAYADPNFVSPRDGVSTAGHNIERFLNTVAHTEVETRTASQETYDIVFSNSELFEIPAGDVGIAFGYQNRSETYSFEPDLLLNSGLGNSSSASFPSVNGSTQVDSLFIEFAVPATDDLELQLAVRYEDHGKQIGTTTDPKIAALWHVSDDLVLRGSFGSSFQAPSAIQTGGIAGSTGVDFNISNGLVTCDTNAESADFIVGTAARVNGTLNPQSADNFNLGAIWQPTDKSNVTVDYWRYKYDGLIVNTQSAQTVLDNDCSDGLLNDPNIVRGSDGVPLFIATTLQNADSAETDGIDATFNYGFENGVGEFDVSLTVSYVLSFDAVVGGQTIKAAGRRNATTDSFGALPELKSNLSLKWSRDNHQAVITARYIDSYLQDDPARSNSLLGKNINSFTTFDVQYLYHFTELFGVDGTFTIGANNLLDQDPPAYGARPYYDDEVHSIRGRVLYGEVKFNF